MSKIVIIGGGAAGMMAAVCASENGHEVHLYEKNEKLGKKIYITGKGRCNLTNNTDVEGLLAAVCTNRKFLYSAFYGFDALSVIDFFEKEGMHVKTERGNRVFPVSDHSSDVIAALASKMRKNGVNIHLNETVREIAMEDLKMDSEAVQDVSEDVSEKKNKKKKKADSAPQKKVTGILLENHKLVSADAVIVATGGFSYRTTGSTGDGYRFAKEAGHKVTDLSPSLVPIETAGMTAQQMQGLSLRNVEVSIFDGKKEIYREFGEMMFTHFGVTGPLILTASTAIQRQLAEHPLQMLIDLKPALSEEQLDARLLREFDAAKNKQFKNVLGKLFPSKMIPVIAELSGIPEDKTINEISKEERRELLNLTKNFPLTLTHLRDYNEAIITRGGVSVKEVDPATMQSKKVNGLYFAGEVLDLDAVTGGYNLQIAWATGHLAGLSVE